jgi:hypothetical protein
MIIENKIAIIMQPCHSHYLRSLSNLDDEDLFIEEFSYRDNGRLITNLISEQLKQPSFTFTGVSVS